MLAFIDPFEGLKQEYRTSIEYQLQEICASKISNEQSEPSNQFESNEFIPKILRLSYQKQRNF